MLRSISDPAVPLYNCRAIQGVPPLTGDGSQFDAHLDHTDPSPLLDDRHTPVPSGGRTFAVAFAVISALLVGLIAGFAAGFFVAQRVDPIPAPRSAAQAVAPVPTTTAQPQTYTDAPVNDQQLPVGRTLSGPPGEPDKARPTSASDRGEASGGVPAAPARGGAVARPTGVNSQPRELNTMRRGPLGSAEPGSLQIASRPTGAQVFVDEVRVGVTPMSLAEVTAGAHRVRIELPGFRRWATAVNVESGTRARVGASLER